MKNQIDQSAHELMATGGDHRIAIDEKIGYNKYGCKPFPAYSIPYSSSTGSNISSAAYAYIKSYIHQLRSEKDNLNKSNKDLLKREFEAIREKLKAYYELDPTVDIIFGPSGTDLEYLCIVLSQKAKKKGIHNIVLGATEVGSGIEFAAKGQYFSGKTPLNTQQKVGAGIKELYSEEVSTTSIPIRHANGKVYSDEELLTYFNREIRRALAAEKHPLVHVVHSTKTGLILPSWGALMELKNNYGTAVDFVVDACQARISIYSINRYLSVGAMVLLTGSKFLSGPPFSGALLLPCLLSKRINTIDDFPKGLTEFFGAAEFPVKWTARGQWPGHLENFGLLLRWQAAVYEMDKLFKIPNPQLKYIIDAFLKSVRQMVKETKFLTLYDDGTKEMPDYVYHRSPFEMNTICTLLLHNKEGGGFSKKEAKLIHKALYSDISEFVGSQNEAETSIQVGQPVKISDTVESQNATLRIALSAHLITELALMDHDFIKTRFFSDMDRIKNKLHLILDNFDVLDKNISID